MSESDVEDSESVTEVIDPVDLSNSRVAEFHAYWLSRHKDNGDIPGLRDLDLMEIYKLAPWIVILDVVLGGNPSIQFRWRFVGTQLFAALFGAELTGQFVHSHVNHEWNKNVQSCYESIVETSVPHMWRCQGNKFTDEPDPIQYTRLLLPLMEQSGAIEHLIGIYVQDDP